MLANRSAGGVRQSVVARSPRNRRGLRGDGRARTRPPELGVKAAELGGWLAANRLEHDAMPVALRPQLPEHRQHAGLNAPQPDLLRWNLDLTHESESALERARIDQRRDHAGDVVGIDPQLAVSQIPIADRKCLLEQQLSVDPVQVAYVTELRGPLSEDVGIAIDRREQGA